MKNCFGFVLLIIANMDSGIVLRFSLGIGSISVVMVVSKLPSG